MELRHPDERDEEPGGARSRHGQALGHRGIRRHEESQHGTGTFIYDIFCIPVYIFYFLRNPDSIGMASLCRIWFPILHFLGSVNYLFFFVTYWYSSFVNTVGMS